MYNPKSQACKACPFRTICRTIEGAAIIVMAANAGYNLNVEEVTLIVDHPPEEVEIHSDHATFIQPTTKTIQ